MTTAVAPYRRTIRLGSVPGTRVGYRSGRYPVEVEVEITGEGADARLSITGSVWKPNRSDIVGGGQNYETLLELFPDDEQVARIVEVWKRWHLNDMRAGCEHQRAEGWNERPIDPSKPTDTYGIHFEGQRSPSWNMLAWVRPDEHPEGLLTKPCSECGYRYGTAWLTEELPQEIIDEVKSW